VLAAEFARRMSVVQLIGAQLCTRRALLQMILFELNLPFRDMDEGELRLALHAHLKPAGKQARRVLLLVDEADSLPMRLLEELRVLTNLSANGAPLVSVVLSGRGILEELFADPKLDVFAQRLAARCYLSAFGRDETLSYVRSQVAAAGDDADELFADDALDAIHSAAGGVPRIINQLGDQLMWIVEQTGCRPLDAALVQQAWSDIQQLPAPWESPAESSSTGEVIEFGELNDEEAFAIECAVEKMADDVPTDLDAINAYDDDETEDMPASISIEIGRQRAPSAPLQHFSESIDSAEALMAELNEVELSEEDVATSESLESAPTTEEQRRLVDDPFDEPFDDEEVVVDQYLTFEASLLSGSQQVVNFGDQALATDLAECQVTAFEPSSAIRAVSEELSREDDGSHAETEVGAASEHGADEATMELAATFGQAYLVVADLPEPLSEVADDDSENAAAVEDAEDDEFVEPDEASVKEASVQLPDDDSTCSEERPTDIGGNNNESSNDHIDEGCGSANELLVVEDDKPMSAQVVGGRNFHRLFTSLESGQPWRISGSS